MTHRITLVTPDAPAPTHPPGVLVTQRKIEKRGIRLGVLDNSKGNADHLLAMIVEAVFRSSKWKDVSWWRSHRWLN